MGAAPASAGSLQKNVDFWIQIYTQYSSHQGLIFDSKYIDHIYETIEFPTSPEGNSKVVKRAKKKWHDLLLSVHIKEKTPGKMSADELRLYQLYRDVQESDKFLKAAFRDRIRFQLGQSDHFKQGLYDSGRYLPIMESIFKSEGLPLELTRLPFVESSFNLEARSKVGASGVWQFMRTTGRQFLKMTAAIDERNDPIRATEAAAKLLKLNFETLKTWPLAVTAYNHGRSGMQRAVRKVASDDLEKIVDQYSERRFGFASRNFFSELLAAVEVERNSTMYFGKIERAKPFDAIEVKIPNFIEIRVLIQQLKIDPWVLKSLNPALSDAVFSGRLLLPAGTILRIPTAPGQNKGIALKQFWDAYDLIPIMSKMVFQRGFHVLNWDCRGIGVRKNYVCKKDSAESTRRK